MTAIKVQQAKPKKSMLVAGTTAVANGWGRGTKLMSSKWTRPREIEQISGDELQLRSKGHGGCAWVKTIPADTKPVE